MRFYAAATRDWQGVLGVPPPPRDLLRYAVAIALAGALWALWWPGLPAWALAAIMLTSTAVMVVDWVRYARWARLMNAAVHRWLDQNTPGGPADGPRP